MRAPPTSEGMGVNTLVLYSVVDFPERDEGRRGFSGQLSMRMSEGSAQAGRAGCANERVRSAHLGATVAPAAPCGATLPNATHAEPDRTDHE